MRVDKTWIQTFSGGKFHPLKPDFELCTIRDQARALSMLCRYGGHVSKFYSVAEHAVRVSRRVAQLMVSRGWDEQDPEVVYAAKWGLIHDNTEGCGFVDIPRPVKVQMPEYKALETACQQQLAMWLGLDIDEPDIVKEVDNEILGTEAFQLKAPVHPDWAKSTPTGKLAEPWEGVTLGWAPRLAERIYLVRFANLFGKDKL